MENPAIWDRATHVISDALAEVDRQRRTSIIGHSPARIIHDALEKEGLLKVAVWQPMSTAPRNASWFRLLVRHDGVDKEVRAHWASDLSGESQPAFEGFFQDYGDGFAEVPGTPIGWLPELSTADNSLSEAKAEHGKTLLLLHTAAFETIPSLEAKFEAHTKAVGEFLNEMYATMVDPVDDFQGTVAELCAKLLEVARKQREHENSDKEKQIRGLLEDAQMWKERALTAEAKEIK